MRKADYIEAVVEFEPLAKWRTLRKWACYKYKLSDAEIEILLELHKVKEFTTEDFGTAGLSAAWNSKRFYEMKENGWIESYRKREGRYKNYNLYNLTSKSKTLIRKLYNILSGKEDFPEESWNKKWTYSKDRLQKKINKQRGQSSLNN